ncbi:MAG TPA: CoA ester lyase [Allosphingosinicella sp.]|uniref:HpcH/HpaI aldolase/citrate lyase family protein n=1 Tax=Allosphingosinicella sp. TaxID=2823234 RepID=UPI002ED77A0A
MNPSDLRRCRSLLFLPASNPRAIVKARALHADMVILDCEDAVKAEEKDQARGAAVEAVADGFPMLTAIRMNAPGTEAFGRDAVAIRDSKADLVVLPKTETYKQVKDVVNLTGKPVLAMIETPAGVLAAAEIAPATAGLIAGTNDLSADLGIPAGASRAGLSLSLQMIVLAARAFGGPAFDGVWNNLEDSDGLASQCEEGRAFGFDGKSVIHPGQIETVNRIFSPTQEEIARAERLVAAASGGAERFEGYMIEDLHVAQAKAALAKAGYTQTPEA